jgi:putative membrane protein
MGVFKGLNVRNVGTTVIIFCVLLSFILTGPYGLFILALATAVGVVPSIINVRRVSCMGAIMLPVILWSLELM